MKQAETGHISPGVTGYSITTCITSAKNTNTSQSAPYICMVNASRTMYAQNSSLSLPAVKDISGNIDMSQCYDVML